MKLKTLLVLNAVVTAVYGVAIVFAPGTVTASYGVTGDAGLRYVAQLFGASLVTFAVLSWFAREVAEPLARTAIVRALFVFSWLAFVLALVAQVNRVTNAVGWSAVVLFFLFGLGWAWFLRPRPTG